MNISRLLISQPAEAATGKCPLIPPSTALKKHIPETENIGDCVSSWHYSPGGMINQSSASIWAKLPVNPI